MQYMELVSVIVFFLLTLIHILVAMHMSSYSQQTLAYTLSLLWTLILHRFLQTLIVCVCVRMEHSNVISLLGAILTILERNSLSLQWMLVTLMDQ